MLDEDESLIVGVTERLDGSPRRRAEDYDSFVLARHDVLIKPVAALSLCRSGRLFVTRAFAISDISLAWKALDGVCDVVTRSGLTKMRKCCLELRAGRAACFA